MHEQDRRKLASPQEQDKTNAHLQASGAYKILQAFNSVIPESSLISVADLRLPIGDDIRPGYVLTGGVLPAGTISLHPLLSRDIYEQSQLSVSSSGQNILLSGYITNLHLKAENNEQVGSGLVFLKPKVLPTSADKQKHTLFKVIASYLEELHMINLSERERAHKKFVAAFPRSRGK